MNRESVWAENGRFAAKWRSLTSLHLRKNVCTPRSSGVYKGSVHRSYVWAATLEKLRFAFEGTTRREVSTALPEVRSARTVSAVSANDAERRPSLEVSTDHSHQQIRMCLCFCRAAVSFPWTCGSMNDSLKYLMDLTNYGQGFLNPLHSDIPSQGTS